MDQLDHMNLHRFIGESVSNYRLSFVLGLLRLTHVTDARHQPRRRVLFTVASYSATGT
jgi:hypothetical protein